MSLAYITTAEAKEYSRIQHAALDDTIGLLIQSASAIVKNYLKDFSPYEGQRNADDDYLLDSNYEPEPAIDSNGEQAVKAEVKLATLYLVDLFLKGGAAAVMPDNGDPPPAVKSILYALRDPALK